MRRLFACISALLLCFVAVLHGGAQQAAAAPAATSSTSPQVAEFQKIEDAWSKAINQRDQYGLELVLSPLFVGVSAAGDITTRDQQVADVLSGSDKTMQLKQRVITVRMLGDVAVANGTYDLRHKANGAKGNAAPVDDKGVFTHVFERVHGRWMCINSQRTLLRTEAQEKRPKAAHGESGFRLGIFSRDNKKN